MIKNKQSNGKDHEDDIETEIVYRYDRERRLDRAPKRIRDFNEDISVKKGFAKSLFSSRGNIFILGSILMICAMFALSSRFLRKEKEVKLGGNSVVMSISMEENINILDITKKAPRRGNVYMGDVDIAVSPVMSASTEEQEIPVFLHRVFFHTDESEVFRIALPFEEKDFIIIIKTLDDIKSVKINAK